MLSNRYLQNLAGAGCVVALPLLYIGLTRDMSLLTALGAFAFVASMAVTPVLQLMQRD